MKLGAATLLLLAAACADVAPPPEADHPMPPPEPTVTLAGIGAVPWGMSIDSARLVLDRALPELDPPPGGSCGWVTIALDGSDRFVMVHEGRIARLDVSEGSLEAPGGGGIGSTTPEVRAAHPGLHARPHKYTDGEYLIVQDPADTLRRIVFETDMAGIVTAWRVGRMPEVEWVEGCS